jgi:hypothetical protein
MSKKPCVGVALGYKNLLNPEIQKKVIIKQNEMDNQQEMRKKNGKEIQD